MEFMSDAVSGDDLYRPSLFELVAQDQLRDLMQPAIRYVLSVMAQRNPRYILRIVNRFDEIYSLVMLLIERYYLREWGSSFAENFYGLKRIRSSAVSLERLNAAVQVPDEYEKLHTKQIRLSLLSLVIMPYLGNKAHDLWEQTGGGFAEDLAEEEAPPVLLSGQQSRWRRYLTAFKIAYRKLYPYANTGWHAVLLIYQVGYLFEKTRFYRPWLALMRVEIRRMSGQDHADGMRRTIDRITPRLSQSLSIATIPAYAVELIRLSPRIAFEGVKYLLPLSIVFFKFLEWWYTSDHYKSSLQNGKLALGPPNLLSRHEKGLPLPDSYGQCPLCHDNLKNPTALPSGYCFCYTCAITYVNENKRCPITFMACSQDQLRRILL